MLLKSISFFYFGELYYQVQQIEKNKEVHTNLW